MMDIIIWILPYLIVSIMLGFLCACVGVHTQMMGVANLTGGIAHFMIGPVGISYVLRSVYNWNIGFFVVGFIATFILVFLLPVDSDGHFKISQEVEILWSLGMALGLFLVFFLPKSESVDLESFLFGSLVTIGVKEIVFIAIVFFFVIFIEFFFYNRFKYLGLDDVFLKSSGISTTFWYRLQLFVTSITILVVLKSIGVLMLIAIIAVPSAIANIFSKTYRAFLFYSIIFSIITIVAGFFISSILQFQFSSFTALMISTIYFISKFFYFWRKK